ncbi:FGGY family carbohydrate kinase [Klebsiella pneumoniae]
MKDKILTIDVGTGSTRAAIVRIDGAMIGFAQREYEQTTPRAGWSEQAPSLWWQAACDCIREVLYRYPETAAQIAVIGACGQMHGTVLLDDRGELVEDRALLWNDKRSQPQVDAFNAREGWEKWLAHLNNPPAAAWPAFKLAWWREMPILSTRNQENGVTGCGIIAGVGVGLYADFASGVRQTVQFDKLISPDPRLRDYYHACCELFDTLYRQSAALYDRLDALSVGPD